MTLLSIPIRFPSSQVQSFHGAAKRLFEFDKRHIQNSGFSHQDIFPAPKERCHLHEKCPQPPFGPGPLNGIADFFTGDNTDAVDFRIG